MAYFTNAIFYVDNTPTDRLWTCMLARQAREKTRESNRLTFAISVSASKATPIVGLEGIPEDDATRIEYGDSVQNHLALPGRLG